MCIIVLRWDLPSHRLLSAAPPHSPLSSPECLPSVFVLNILFCSFISVFERKHTIFVFLSLIYFVIHKSHDLILLHG